MSIISVPTFRHSGKFRLRSGMLGLVLLASLAGCSLDNPLGRSFGWFSYLDAADIRDRCSGSAGERYRLVYNAVWGEQVRSYDIAVEPGGASATLAAGGDDPVEAARGKDEPARRRRIEIAHTQGLAKGRYVRCGQGGGAGVSTIKLQRIEEVDFTEIFREEDACREGVFHYNAYVYPSASFAGIRFDRWLFARDTTGVAVVPPGQVGDNGPHVYFEMMVGANGLVGVGSPF